MFVLGQRVRGRGFARCESVGAFLGDFEGGALMLEPTILDVFEQVLIPVPLWHNGFLNTMPPVAI